MTPDLERVRENWIDEQMSRVHDSGENSIRNSLKLAWDACIAHLSADCEFDEILTNKQAKTEEVIRDTYCDSSFTAERAFIKGARWQFDQMAGRVALAEQAVTKTHNLIAPLNKELHECLSIGEVLLKERADLEARLAESEENLARTRATLERSTSTLLQITDEFKKSKARCKELEALVKQYAEQYGEWI